MAVYFKEKDHTQLRIDFLELEDRTPLEIKLLLDTQPGTNEDILISEVDHSGWDHELIIFQNEIFQPNADSDKTSVFLPTAASFDTQMDTLLIEWNKDFKPENLKLMVFSRIVGEETWQDKTETISEISKNIMVEAPLLFEFWNVLPAETPAQILRYWDGAHSGPFGRRHGLKHLLAAAEVNDIPLALLDLQDPKTLSAVNFLGQKPYIDSLLSKDLLILPLYKNYALSRTPDSSFDWTSGNFISSDFLFTNSLETLTGHFTASFINTPANSHIYAYAQKKLIPLPSNYFLSSTEDENSDTADQITSNGLSLEIKKALVNLVYSEGKKDLLILGGNFLNSPWGDPQMSADAMNYIKNHPWINVLDRNEILSFPTTPVSEMETGNCTDLLCTPIEMGLYSNIYLDSLFLEKFEIRKEIEALPKNEFSNLAQENFLYLINYPVDLNILALKLNYLYTIKPLIEASAWLENPVKQQFCSDNLCYLSSESLFFAFSQNNGSLIFAGSNINHIPLQWISSSANAGVGLSDPSAWQVKQNRIIDTSVIDGTYSDEEVSEGIFSVYFMNDGIIFKNQQTKAEKAYQITGNSLKIKQNGINSQNQYIPIVFSKLILISPDWRETSFPEINYSSDQLQINFGKEDEIIIKIQEAEILSVNSFTDSYTWINEPEDPDRENPDGHYYPLPLILVKIKNGDSFETSISFDSK